MGAREAGLVMTVKLSTPHPYPERILLYGGGGSGKTNAAISVIDHAAHGNVYVVETDYSASWQRAIYTDYPHLGGQVDIRNPDVEWESWTAELDAVVSAADPAVDWLVIDSITPTWEAVQGWWIAQSTGNDLPRHLAGLKKAHGADAKAYGRALTDTMNWPLIKKEYAARVIAPLQRWKGHLIITAEAKGVGDQDNDEIQMLYGPVQLKPSGEGRLMYLASTNVLLSHPKRGVWTFTSVKDRNRAEVEKQPFDDFGYEYLSEVAGWEIQRRVKSDPAG